MIVILVKLGQGEGQRVTGPGVVALETFRPAGIVPGLVAPASRGFGVRDGDAPIHAGRGDKRGVRLLVVPGITVTPPTAAVVVEDLGLKLAAALRTTTLHFQRNLLA